MVFVPPSWIEGLLVQVGYIVIPSLIFALIAMGIVWKKMEDSYERGFATACSFGIVLVVALIAMSVVGSVIWFNAYEVPSVQEKIVTVKEWQPTPGSHSNGNGMMEITNADELMLITTEDEGFFNQENLYFNKWNTRDILFALKPGGTYKIKYYGWREGKTSSFPNILSVEQVIDESNATKKEYNDYFGIKIAQ